LNTKVAIVLCRIIPGIAKTILIYKKSNLIAGVGGVKKFISWFSGALATKGYRVFVTTRDKREGDLFYPLHKQVVFHHFHIHFSRLRRVFGQLGLGFIPYFNRELHVARIIRAYCEEIKPDIIICEGIQDLADIVYDNPYPCPKIVQLHSEPSVFFTKKKSKLFKKVLKLADVVQVLWPSFVKSIQQYYAGKVAVIGNPVPGYNQAKRHQPIIIYPGRMEDSKQQHLLIEAFFQNRKGFSGVANPFLGRAE